MKPEWVTAVAAIASALTTIMLVWLTSRYVTLTRELAGHARATREPSVFVDFELESTDEVILTICNSGPTSARNVTFDVSDNIPLAIRGPTSSP